MSSNFLIRVSAFLLLVTSLCEPRLALACVASHSSGKRPSSFVMQDLGALGAVSEGYFVNENGDVAGINNYLGNPNVIRTFLYKNNQMTDIGTLPGATDSFPTGINANGDIAGTSGGNNISHAFLYRNGQMIDLGTLGGSSSNAVAINANGDVIGYSATAGDLAYHGFLYRSGQMIDLGTLGGQNSTPRAINDNGDVVGESDVSGNNYSHAFLYRNGQMIDLNPSGYVRSWAIGINNNGEIAGNADLNNQNLTPIAFVHRNGQTFDLGSLGGSNSKANDLSNTGYITGRSYLANPPNDPPYHAFRVALTPSATKLKIAGGNILVGSPGQGIILKSPGGATCKKLSINNAGALVLATVACP